MRSKALVLLLAALSLASCREEGSGFDETLYRELTGPALISGGHRVFEYDPLTCQLFHDPAGKVYRVGTDTMKDYFEIAFSSTVLKEGSTVAASVKCCTSEEVTDYGSSDFEIVRMDDSSLCWLWSRELGLAVVIKLIHS